MYIETRTTHTEVLDSIIREVHAQANSLTNSVWTIKVHPTYLTKTMLKEQYHEFNGAVALARRVFGGALPDAVEAKVIYARTQAREFLYPKK
jgi:hypothetical protein